MENRARINIVDPDPPEEYVNPDEMERYVPYIHREFRTSYYIRVGGKVVLEFQRDGSIVEVIPTSTSSIYTGKNYQRLHKRMVVSFE